MTTPQQQPTGYDAWSPTPPPAQPLYGPPGYRPAPRWNVASIFALVTAFFLPLAAVILGRVSLRQIARTGEQGKPVAIVALVIGGLGCLGWVLFWTAVLSGGGSFSYSVGG